MVILSNKSNLCTYHLGKVFILWKFRQKIEIIRIFSDRYKMMVIVKGPKMVLYKTKTLDPFGILTLKIPYGWGGVGWFHQDCMM